MILASAYVLCHFLSSKLIYQVELCEVRNKQIDQAEHNLTEVQKNMSQGTRVMWIGADAESVKRYGKR